MQLIRPLPSGAPKRLSMLGAELFGEVDHVVAGVAALGDVHLTPEELLIASV
jgi:hypothetical protein